MKAARRLLKKQGLGDICMDALAEEAGVGKGTLYRRFPDRAALVHALLDEDTRVLQDKALAGFDLPENTASIEQALVLFAAIFDFVAEHASLLCEAEFRGNKLDHPAYAWQRTLLAGHLRDAIKRGESRAIDPWITAEIMLSSATPDLVRWMMQQGRSPAELRDESIALWRRALSL